MRGVYATAISKIGSQTGSSPHARGLRPCPGPVREPGGIIPACAGFTWTRPPSTPSTPDHPRTRGVYLFVSKEMMASPGSSPHTRGLRLRGGWCRAAVRIIPAHAGFTPPAPSAGGCPADHPRTRGVYLHGHRAFTMNDGSSPHTRGLPDTIEPTANLRRIIPAHAGFTPPPGRQRPSPPDHPRTRGVYER